MKNSDYTPRLIFWELTKNCNLKCKHCRAEADFQHYNNELNVTQAKQVIDNISSFSKPVLVLTGGEPLYKSGIFEIAGYANAKGLTVALATNGTLINEHKALQIKKASIKRVSISIDGMNAETHDSFRGVPGSFNKAIEGASLLVKQGVNIQLNTTIVKNNYKQVPEIIKLAESQNAVALHLFVLVPVGCGIEIVKEEKISKNDYENILKNIYAESKKTNLEIKVTCAPHYYRIIREQARLENRQLTFEKDGMSAMTKGCLAGSGVCFISNIGDVQPCGYLPVKAGNVLEQPFEQIWNNSEDFKKMRNTDLLKGKCGICEYKEYCSGCRARAYYHSNDYLAEEPICAYNPKKVLMK